MDKARRDEIEAGLPADRRFRMPAFMTDKMRIAAYQAYCAALKEKRYISWNDICACFMAAEEARILEKRKSENARQ